MLEAERCDRVSLMHAGKVLGIGHPQTLADDVGASNLEDAFIAHLEHLPDGPRDHEGSATSVSFAPAGDVSHHPVHRSTGSLSRVWAFALREAIELSRDPVRIAFAVLGPLSLLITLGYGITFDVNKLDFAVFDRDRSVMSRELVEQFASSNYFELRPQITERQAIDRRLKSGELNLVISIPPDFGRDLVQGRQPEVAFFLDGSNAFSAETARGYVQGIMQIYAGRVTHENRLESVQQPLYRLQPRYRYNQDFRSAFSIAPRQHHGHSGTHSFDDGGTQRSTPSAKLARSATCTVHQPALANSY